MRLGKLHRLRVAGLLLGAATCLCADNFTPPAEGPVAFRRDRIPLDVETITELSRHLVTLAEGLDFKRAASRRAAAQMLALTVALDPANTAARELIAQFQKKEAPPTTDPEELAKCRERIRQLLTWLETPEAGSQGQALAACLTDVMRISDPEYPLPEALRAAGERGAWKGWVPELAAYEPVVAVPPTPPEEPPPAKPAILLSMARVFTPFWKRVGNDESAKWILSPVALEMTAKMTPTVQGEPQPFSMIIGGTRDDSHFSQLSIPLLQVLRKQHGTLPAGARVTINSEAFVNSLLSEKLQTLSAAAAVLASSSISGREPDATIIGLIDENGEFKLPSGFWDLLQSLGPGKGGRLVLPSAAAEYLPSMLALGKPGFFLEYEVLLASNFQQLLDFSEKTPQGTVETASTQFREIREKVGSQAIGQYLANSFVRRRLAELTRDAPFHHSAKMLALQGAGNRPVYLPRLVLACELRRAIEPIDRIVKRKNSTFEMTELDQIGSAHDACRGELERLFRYAEKNDRELLAHVQEMVVTLRPLERALRARDSRYSWSTESYDTYSTLTRVYAEVTAELATLIGDHGS